jgi:hypothetical protein
MRRYELRYHRPHPRCAGRCCPIVVRGVSAVRGVARVELMLAAAMSSRAITAACVLNDRSAAPLGVRMDLRTG